MKNIFVLTSVLAILAGCSTLNNPYYYPKNTYQFKLNQPVTVPAGSSNAYVLDGQVVRRAEIDTFDVYCKLSVPRSKKSDELIIEPGVFKINNTYQRYYSYQQVIPEADLQVASLVASFSGGGNGGSSRQDLTLYFDLESENQGYVKSMSCVRFADPRPDNLVTLEDAKQVFKDLGHFSTQ